MIKIQYSESPRLLDRMPAADSKPKSPVPCRWPSASSSRCRSRTGMPGVICRKQQKEQHEYPVSLLINLADAIRISSRSGSDRAVVTVCGYSRL